MYMTRQEQFAWGDLYGHLDDRDYDEDEEDLDEEEIEDEEIEDEFTQRIHYHMNLSRPQRQRDALQCVLDIYHGDRERTAERIDYFVDYYKPRGPRETSSEWHWNWHYGWILAREVISNLV